MELGNALTVALEQEGATLEALHEAIVRTRTELEMLRAAVGAGLSGETETVRQGVALEAATVERSFQDYFHLLSLCELHRQAPSGESWLQAAAESLPLVRSRLNAAQERLREAVLVERGPWTHAGVNRVLQAAATAQPSELNAAVEEELGRMDLVLGEGHLGGKLRQELLPEELAAYQAMQRWLESTPSSGVPDGDWAAEGERVGEAFAKADRDFFRRRYQTAPTSSPALNLVIQAAHFQAEGQLTRSVVEWFRASARDWLTELRARLTPLTTKVDRGASLLERLDALGTALEEPTLSPDFVLAQARALEHELGSLTDL